MKLSARNILENRSPYNAGEANSYPRGFLAVNCNGVIILSLGKNSSFMVLLKPRSDKKKLWVARRVLHRQKEIQRLIWAYI